LKPAGKRKFTQLRDIAAGLQLEILDVLPEKDREKFLEQLADIAEAGHATAEEAARTK